MTTHCWKWFNHLLHSPLFKIMWEKDETVLTVAPEQGNEEFTSTDKSANRDI